MLNRRTFLAVATLPLVGTIKADEWSMLDDVADPKWDMLTGPAPVKTNYWESGQVLLFFNAEWCGPCKQIKDKVFPELKKLNWRIGGDSDCHILPIDADTHPDLLSKHSIKALPTFLLLKDGKQVGRLEGAVNGKQITDLWYKNTERTTLKKPYIRHTETFTDIIPHNRQRYIEHLSGENIHRGKFSLDLLNSLSDKELLALHSDDHAGTVDWPSLGINRSKAQAGNCATGNCQTIQQYAIPRRRSLFGLLEW